MGLFSSSSSSSASPSGGDAGPTAASGGGTTRSSRQACWTHRDAYFDCLTSHNVTIPPGTDMSDGRGPIGKAAAEDQARRERERKLSVEEQRNNDPCKPQRDGYERNCAQSWVSYFNKRRVLEERQKLMYASGQVPVGAGPAPGRDGR